MMLPNSYWQFPPSWMPSREEENINATLSSAEKRPSALDNWLIDRFFFDRADKSTISVIENVSEDDEIDEVIAVEEEEQTDEKVLAEANELSAKHQQDPSPHLLSSTIFSLNK
jgi:hypothetical protein